MSTTATVPTLTPEQIEELEATRKLQPSELEQVPPEDLFRLAANELIQFEIFARNSADTYWYAGRLFHLAKMRCKHGEWGKFLAEHNLDDATVWRARKFFSTYTSPEKLVDRKIHATLREIASLQNETPPEEISEEEKKKRDIEKKLYQAKKRQEKLEEALAQAARAKKVSEEAAVARAQFLAKQEADAKAVEEAKKRGEPFVDLSQAEAEAEAAKDEAAKDEAAKDEAVEAEAEMAIDRVEDDLDTFIRSKALREWNQARERPYSFEELFVFYGLDLIDTEYGTVHFYQDYKDSKRLVHVLTESLALLLEPWADRDKVHALVEFLVEPSTPPTPSQAYSKEGIQVTAQTTPSEPTQEQPTPTPPTPKRTKNK